MRRPSVDDMLENKTTRYALVIGVAKRARQIAAQFEKENIITDENLCCLPSRILSSTDTIF